MNRQTADNDIRGYARTRNVFILLVCILLLVVLWKYLLPDEIGSYGAKIVNVYETVYASRIRRLINSSLLNDTARTRSKKRLKQCNFSMDYIDKHKGNLSDLITHAQSVESLVQCHIDLVGGAWKPRNCIARHRVAIVIPYRNRKEHLVQLLSVLLPFLKAQKLDFRIYLAEQDGNSTYNKGILMNAGFLEALKDRAWDCFVFHDVDLVPRNIRIVYSCPAGPRHLSAVIDEFNDQLPYDFLVGGILVMRTEDFVSVNGYSNMFWGWGGEDDDMFKRIQQARLRLERLPYSTARYHQIKHTKRNPAVWEIRYGNLKNSETRMRNDGINSVVYRIIARTDRPLFVHLLIDVGKLADS